MYTKLFFLVFYLHYKFCKLFNIDIHTCQESWYDIDFAATVESIQSKMAEMCGDVRSLCEILAWQRGLSTERVEERKRSREDVLSDISASFLSAYNQLDELQSGLQQCYWGGRDLASEFESDFVKLHQVPPFRLPWCPFEGSHRKIRLLMDQTSDGSRTITWSGSSWR